MESIGWERVGAAIKAARASRWPYRPEFADVTGLSVSTLLSIEKGHPKQYHPATLDKIERALGWAEGDIDRIRHGGEPTYEPSLRYVMDHWDELEPQVKAIIVGMVDDALAAS